MMKRLYLVAGVIASFLGCNPPTAGAYTGAFLSFPHQPAPLSVSGNDVVIANKSWQGFPTKVCLTVHNAHNVYIHDVDFDSCGGGIYLVDVTGDVQVRRVRARNIGDGTIGSGHSNVIQLSRVWTSRPDDGVADIQSVKVYGGDTEDAISVYKSGGVDAAHPLVLGDIHIEHPLSGPLAWTSGSGTCINLADAGGHDIRLQNSTFLNCGQVGIQMNEPTRTRAVNNKVYGAARPGSNVGLSQWSSGSCSTCTGNEYRDNRVWWVKSNGSASPMWLSKRYPVADVNNVKQDSTLNPATLKVVL